MRKTTLQIVPLWRDDLQNRFTLMQLVFLSPKKRYFLGD